MLGLCAAVRRTFDLAADPARIAVALGGDPLLAPLLAARPGLRLIGSWDLPPDGDDDPDIFALPHATPELIRRAESWRPFRGYAAAYLADNGYPRPEPANP